MIGDKTESCLSIPEDGKFVRFCAFAQSSTQVLDRAMVVVNNENLSRFIEMSIHKTPLTPSGVMSSGIAFRAADRARLALENLGKYGHHHPLDSDSS